MELLGLSGPPIDLGIQPDEEALQRASRLTRCPVEAIGRQTFLGLRPTWPRRWATWTDPFTVGCFGRLAFHDLPRLQVCRSCLREDLAIGTQFLRIRWLSAASTFCRHHREPLQTPCTACRGADSFYCRRVPPRFVFLCPECERTLDSGQYDIPIDPHVARLLMQFEEALGNALDGWKPRPRWVGSCTAKQFTCCVEDLVWALTQPTADWFGSPAPIEWFQVRAVPLLWRFEAYRSFRHRLARSSVWLRRALLAAALGVLCEEARSIFDVGALDVRFRHDLPAMLEALNPAVRDQLARRSHRWPRRLLFAFDGVAERGCRCASRKHLRPAGAVYRLKKNDTLGPISLFNKGKNLPVTEEFPVNGGESVYSLRKRIGNSAPAVYKLKKSDTRDYRDRFATGYPPRLL
jgi:hypothetical protein